MTNTARATRGAGVVRDPDRPADVAADLHAYLSYRDTEAALAWLSEVGFELVRRQDAEDGSLAHAEVRCGSVVLMVAGAHDEYSRPALRGTSTGSGLYLCLPSPAAVDRWYFRAVSAGGVPVIEPEATEWGTRRARVLDPEGHEWSVGTYRPG
ncbi:glyoxalase [Streptomyces sp. NE5-10]|uniref:VOC family protein n=1 Tax=Streptomyces sp. NE5-10 TaxID=2759674 RepID=UPI001A586ADC|nr:VOC family protein [Streptomyces sp. NE5-10]GHJ98051.1 glyoxalase [Streptomyces sp. NE5-10]